MSDIRSVISPQAAPPAGPYSHAIVYNGLVFVAGQGGVNSAGKLSEGVEAQTRQTLSNLDAILAAAGTERSRVLKTTVFLKNMNDFAAMNAVYAEFFGSHRPARSTVEVARLPLDILVEIECVAAVGA